MTYRLPGSRAAGRGNSGDSPGIDDLGAARKRRRRRAIAALPTLFTLGNLLCGFASIFMSSRDPNAGLMLGWTPLTYAAILIFAGMLMDALDGRVARMTRSTSDLGEQLDSMADMVTFGVAPAFMAVQLIGVQSPFIGATSRVDIYFDRLALVIACIYVSCVALRLARFNIEVSLPEEASHASFKGLPSPGAAATVASLVLLHQHFLRHAPPESWTLNASATAMVGVMLLVAFAMVSRLRYAHMVNRYLRGRVPFRRLALIVIVGLLLLSKFQESLAAVCVLYALSAPSLWLWNRITGKPSAAPVTAASAMPGVNANPTAPHDETPRQTGT